MQKYLELIEEHPEILERKVYRKRPCCGCAVVNGLIGVDLLVRSFGVCRMF